MSELFFDGSRSAGEENEVNGKCVCDCGNTVFAVLFPEPYTTVVKCTSCEQEMLVHEG